MDKVAFALRMKKLSVEEYIALLRLIERHLHEQKVRYSNHAVPQEPHAKISCARR